MFLSIATGVGLRQTARNVGLTRRNTELKFRKLARHLRRLNLRLRGPLPEGAELQLDEFETFEGRRNTRPLSVPVLIDSASRFAIWAESATIRPSGRMTPKRLLAIARDEARYGRRKDRSSRAVERTLRRGADLLLGRRVRLSTDEKSTYPAIARRVFGRGNVAHSRTSSKLPRTVRNPLFPINHTEAMLRDLLGRLRRRSWLAS